MMILRKRIAILLAALMIAVTGVQATTMVAAAVDTDFAAVALAGEKGQKNGHNGDGDGGGDGQGGGKGSGNNGEHRGQGKNA
jgi:hypothetical protein